MPDPIHPRAFMAEYVEPAVALYQTDPAATHLAAHALAQMDILAAVVANHKLLGERRSLPPSEEKGFRDELGRRMPILQVIKDAHDAHKHGRLTTAARNFADGMQPKTVTSYGWFYDVSFYGGPPVELQSTFLVLRDGTEIQIDFLLIQALQAWTDEFTTLFAD